MNLNASVSLQFDGECESAFKTYEQLLGGQLQFVLPWGASPLADQAPPGWAGKILFARLRCRDLTLLGGDALPGTYQRPAGFNLTLRTADPQEAERYFEELAKDGGTARMPLKKTFWAERYGLVTDRFGTPWEINCAQAH
jgi:PhnB protein